MKDPTPETPLTADDLGKIASDGMDGYIGRNKERRTDLAARNAAYLRDAVASLARPDVKSFRWWARILSVASGVGLSIWAAAGGNPADVQLGREIAGATSQIAEGVASGAETGDWEGSTAGVAGGALVLAGLLGNKRRKQ